LPDLRTIPIRRQLHLVVRLARQQQDQAIRLAHDAPAAASALSADLRREGFTPPLVASAFALIRVVASRVLGMAPYDVQLMGAHAMLLGRLAEMQTGEGKTLCAGLAAATAALAGHRVHVVTVNDYLAERDHATLEPLYRALGLRAGLILHDATPEQRRAAYACDITYASNKELTFDYLRDQILFRATPSPIHRRLVRLDRGQAPREPVLRGLVFAIVDEADSVLIDEARTPLIISETVAAEAEYRTAQEALALIESLVYGEDYRVDRSERMIELSQAGQRRIATLAETKGAAWGSRLERAELVRKALTAKLLFERDVQYLVRDGRVQIIDEYTGRIMPDRFWNDGLQQMVEAKEGCAPSDNRASVARITYQRFFTRYLHLCGMSGTLREAGAELRSVYGLGITRIPTNLPPRRRTEPTVITATAAEKWRVIASRALEIAAEGRPVLIGTRTVAASDHASLLLTEAGMDHALLNASQDAREAAVVAAAGQGGRITIATNMAGRGTDIHLAAEVAERGGLAVILCERHDAGRIDRQLAGRCARQGQPGSVAAILSLEDPLLDPLRGSHAGRALLGIAARRPAVARLLFDLLQRRAERRHRMVRRDLMKFDAQLMRSLSFSGRPD